MPFQKGHKLATGRPKGSLNKSTLSKLERRAIFEEEVSEMWRETIKKMRPEYIGDQFMGKAKDIVEVIERKEPSERIKELAKKLKQIDG